MALTKVTTGVTDLNQAQSTNGLKFPTGSVFAGTPEEGMIRNDQSQSSETSSSTMQFYNGTAWKNFVNKTPIPLGSDNFNTVLYTGNSSTQAITGVGFAPDFTWIKRRNSAEDHAIYDSVRGTNKQLSSNTSSTEATNSSPYLGLTSFDSDGFTSGNNGGTNRSPNTYVAWNWKAGGAAVSNTDGTITSQVSANTAAGFSIVSQVASTGSWTVGHGLDAAPEIVFYKNLDLANAWGVWVTGFTDRDTLYLNLTNAKTSVGSGTLYGSVPTSTTIGTSSWLANSGNRVIAYCFHSVAGYSKIGSFVGNGSTVNVVTGFEPAFIMWKNISQGSASYDYWFIVDNKTSPSNPVNKVLYPNDSIAETTTSYTIANFNSNGFDIVGSAGGRVFNNSGDTYIYITFAAT
jgi:hypothetical protein